MATNLEQEFNLSLTEVSNLFKIRYGPKSENTYNSANVLLGRVKKSFNWGGKRMEFPVPTSFQGGVGSGALPEANVADTQSVQFTAKKMYAVARYDRETIKAASTNQDAFFQETRLIAQKTVESWTRNMSRALFGESDGKLGTVGSVVDNGGGNYTLTLDDTSPEFFKEANFEEKDFVNIETGNTDLFEIESVDPDTPSIDVQIQAGGTQVPVATDEIFMQGSEDNDPEGLRGVLDAAAGSKYNVTIGRRWQAVQKAAAGGGITPDRINNAMLEVEKKSGKVPNLIVTSYLQYEKILNQLEDQKRYTLNARQQPGKGKIIFEGVEFMSTMGPVGIFPERFCEDDRLYCLNDNFIEIFHRPGFGWFDDDGTVFLRVAGEDQYEARYGGYLEAYIAPPFHAVISGLST